MSSFYMFSDISKSITIKITHATFVVFLSVMSEKKETFYANLLENIMIIYANMNCIQCMCSGPDYPMG